MLSGQCTVGLTLQELERLIDGDAAKLNTSNLGLAIHQRADGATTVSTTIEVAARAGVRIITTGGLGGVHRGFGHRLDVSADLTALTRWPVGIVCSGVKSILDIESTREALETLGVPVIGYRTDRFPAFLVSESSAGVDARLDGASAIASFVSAELCRASRAVVIAHPEPAEAAIDEREFSDWLKGIEQEGLTSEARGRTATPTLLAQLNERSSGKSLAANLSLLRANAALACEVALDLSRQNAQPPSESNG